jgi:SAM-dependent methyltransferase
MQSYVEKQPKYFGNPRVDIEKLLPEFAERTLEVGCGNGATLDWLKSTRRTGHTVGLELFEAAADVARECCDEVLCGDAERLMGDVPGSSIDLLLLLDVLEHLVDPWAFLRTAYKAVRPGGTVICSVPNVRHYNVVLPLLFRGRWTYTDEGLLDRTHLRFFTRETSVALVAAPEVTIVDVVADTPPRSSKADLLLRFSAGKLADLVAVRYLIAARKN